MIKFEKISFSYGKKKVFENFSLDIAAGERVALMGASGSGKSTLLRLAARLIAPQGGLVDAPERVAFVFQQSRLVPQLDALANCVLVGADEARAAAILAELGLAGELHTLPGELSGGMARRVALARALAFESDALLLDEPFSGLDEQNRRIAAETTLRHLGGRTLLAATHAAEEAELLGARVVRL